MIFLIANTALPEMPNEGDMSESEKEFWGRFWFSCCLLVVGWAILMTFMISEGRKGTSPQPAEGQSSTITSNENSDS